MTYKDYSTRGYFYTDYLRLSQWQRTLGVWRKWRKNRYTSKFSGVIWSRLWSWGWRTEQACDAFCLGPIQFIIGYR